MNNPTARVLAVLGLAIALCAGCELAEPESDSLETSAPVGNLAAALTTQGVSAASFATEVERGGALKLDPDPTPDPPSDCWCISFPDPGECPEERFFCNIDRSCVCDTGGRLDTVLAPVATVAVLSAGRSAPESSTEPAPGTKVTARINTSSDPTPPVQEIGCICGPGSVSAPASDCNPANWYCNASAVCRCRR